ncbi:MAG: FAD:protein FMN transferase [Eubacterium sp.]|nr:FAD:protein FMN transferase [Eubacterium sp.]
MTKKNYSFLQHICLCLALCGTLAFGCTLSGCDLPFPLSGTQSASSDAQVAEDAGTYFDTVIDIRVYGADAKKLLKGCFSICEDMENTLSAQKESSELYHLNHRSTDSVTVSDDLSECIRQGLAYGAMSDGAFDITIYPVKELWDFEGDTDNPVIPDDESIQKALQKVDYTKVHVNGNTVTFDSPDTMIDLGGIAKGYISLKLKNYLKENGCTSAMINLGGNVSVLGAKPDGSPFVVGIQKPFADRGEVLTTVDAEDESVISSGVYERYFKKNGKLYHHILDPKTGYPADTSLNQATVIGSDDVLGDALSTICILLGEEKAEKLIRDNNLAVTVLFTDTDNQVTRYPEEAGNTVSSSSVPVSG